MRTKIVLFLLTLCTCMMSQSTLAFGQKLYPVQGPLASQTPQPVFLGQIRHPIFTLGPAFLLLKSWTLSNGEVVAGKPKTVKATSVNKSVTSADAPPQPNLAFAWDAIYGDGFFVSKILGNKIGQGIFKGSQGTILQVETLDGEKGVAADNKGNIYKMVWR